MFACRRPITTLIALAAIALQAVAAPRSTPAHAGVDEPGLFVAIVGRPDALTPYWHDQRGKDADVYACALYAQASVLEAIGYDDFDDALATIRALGLRDGWFSPESGAIGLGQPLSRLGIPFERFGSPIEEGITHQDALRRLERALLAGRYPVVNLDATRLSAYRDSRVTWHTIWVTGLRLDGDGQPVAVFANDSWRGAGVEYPVNEFLEAWASEFNYYAIFIERPTRSRELP